LASGREAGTVVSSFVGGPELFGVIWMRFMLVVDILFLEMGCM